VRFVSTESDRVSDFYAISQKMAGKKQYRITTFFKKRPDLTEQQFYDHWGNVHGPLVIPWALHHGVLEYTQYQTPETLRRTFSSKMDPAFNTSIEYDAAADWYVDSYEAYLAAYTDPYYINVIEPDEHNFVDKGQLDESNAGKQTIVRAVSTLGFCRSMIKDGKPSIDINEKIWQDFSDSKLRKTDAK